MTTTPRWKNEEPGNTPTGLSHAGHAQNLSDLDSTQPSLKVSGSDRVHPGTTPSPMNAGGGDAINNTIASTRSPGNEDPLVGSIFAERYEVLELLGRGGMGSVYKVCNQINKNLRALKLMHAHLVADPQVFRRFQQEATAAARINHANAITIIDMGMAADGRPYLIMDFLDGMSLAELLKYKGKLPIRDALHIFTQMCGALAEAHSHGVIHRDIKPSNVMLLDEETSTDYVVKVVDFGIAKVFPQEGDPTMKDTTTGELFGSPPYMSPEQCLGKRLDYRSDIYSMGCLMYEVLTGAPPLVGQNALGTMYRQINDMPTPLSDIKDDVRLIQRLDEIITRSLQKLPDNRYQSILELHQDLESAGELSAKRLKALSAVGLKLQTLKRATLNRMGSSKKTVIASLVICLAVIGAGGLFVAPYVLPKDPGAAERVISWQALRAENQGSTNGNLGFELRINEARMLHGKISEQLFDLRSKYADFLFADEKKDKAIAQYDLACAIGKGLKDEKFSNCQNPHAALDVYVKDQLRLAQLLSGFSPAKMEKLKAANVWQDEGLDSPPPPRELAQSTFIYLKDSASGSDENYAYLSAIVGLENAQVAKSGGQDGAKAAGVANQCFEEVLSRWEKVDVSPEQGETFASVLSHIGDYYLSSNEPDALINANRAFELARKSWLAIGAKDSKSIGTRGLNNAAVAEDRLGHVQRLLGHNKAAAKYFGKAAEDFKAASKTDTIDRAKDLFNQADAQWAAGEYFKSMQTHKAASTIWSATRTG